MGSILFKAGGTLQVHLWMRTFSKIKYKIKRSAIETDCEERKKKKERKYVSLCSSRHANNSREREENRWWKFQKRRCGVVGNTFCRWYIHTPSSTWLVIMKQLHPIYSIEVLGTYSLYVANRELVLFPSTFNHSGSVCSPSFFASSS